MSQPTHTVTITGVQSGIGPLGNPPARMEINDLVDNPMMFSLYIQALAAMMSTKISQKDVLSHFQIGGIHGKPYIRWDNSGGQRPTPNSWPGYCTHGSVLFPSWHRPYVALYEQTLHSHVMEVAASYTSDDKLEWQKAADTFRCPYWDWAAKSVPPSQVISDATVTILAAPQATSKDVPNPLLGYTFNPLSDGQFDAPWNRWPRTLRCPSSRQVNATSNVNELVRNLTGRNGQISFQLTQSTYFLLTQIDSWLDMSNHTPNINPNAANSLEHIHDNIHGYVGGGFSGHMGNPTVAAMDPIFMLHHCNVDRILALWQAIHYKSRLEDSVEEDGTFTIRSGSRVTATSDLTPFWNGPDTYWKTEACYDTNALHYTYPEFVGHQGVDPDALADHIKDVVDQLYGGGTGGAFTNFVSAATVGGVASTARAAGAAALSGAAAVVQTAQAALVGGPQQAPQASESPAAQSVRDWAVRVQSKKFQLGGSYSIIIFLGPVPEDPKEWLDSPSMVGTDEVFANSAMGACENCQENAGMVVEGYVHLNLALASAGLTSLDPDVVNPYLKENLAWRVLQDCELVPLTRLDSLKVTVTSTPLHLRTGDKFPQAGHVEHYHEITRDQPGGFFE